MSVWKLYRYEDQVLAPTMVVTDQGVFVETQPVQSVAADSKADIIDLLIDVLSSKPGQAQESDLGGPELVKENQPVLLEILGIRKWQDFEKRALMYTLHRNGDELTMHVTGRGADGMWSIKDSQQRNFNIVDSLTAACESIAAELSERRPVNSPRLLGAPAALPAPKDPPGN